MGGGVKLGVKKHWAGNGIDPRLYCPNFLQELSRLEIAESILSIKLSIFHPLGFKNIALTGSD